MKLHALVHAFVILFAMLSCSCTEPEVTVKKTLTVTPDSLEFVIDGGVDTIHISTDSREWHITTTEEWISTNLNFGITKVRAIAVTVAKNNVRESRTGYIIIAAPDADTVRVKVNQITRTASGTDYPDYSNPIAPDNTGMNSTALQLAANMYAGWNLGNTLEVPGSETGWGNPRATQLLIDSIKAAGFNAIRLPCSWNSYVENLTTAKIKDSWLARVKEVVDYCYKNNMYVIINIHWDGGWLENNPTYDKQEEVNAKQKAYWEQIAVYFRDYDEHLLFAGTNEVHANYGTPSVENNTVQQSFNQTFVDAVRSTGGRNAYRNLVIQAYNTNIDHAVNYLKIADDSAEDRLFVEVHYYDPWDFCGDEGGDIYLWGNPFKTLGKVSTWGQESHVLSQFNKMKTKYVTQGYPVVFGEYGAIRRSALTGEALNHHLASRAYYLGYVTEQAKNYGLVPFYWDNGHTGNNGFALFNRNSATTFDRQALNAIQEGASKGVYPF